MTKDIDPIWCFQTNSAIALYEQGILLEKEPLLVSGKKTASLNNRTKDKIFEGCYFHTNKSTEKKLVFKNAILSGIAHLVEIILNNELDDMVIDSLAFFHEIGDKKFRIIFKTNSLKNRPPEDKYIQLIKSQPVNQRAFKRGIKVACLDSRIIMERGDYVHSDLRRLRRSYYGNIRHEIIKGINQRVCVGVD